MTKDRAQEWVDWLHQIDPHDLVVAPVKRRWSRKQVLVIGLSLGIDGDRMEVVPIGEVISTIDRLHPNDYVGAGMTHTRLNAD